METNLSDPKKGAAKPLLVPAWRLYAILGLVALGMIGAMFYVEAAANRMVTFHTPLADAATKLRLEATTGYLWFEEHAAGVPHVDTEVVWGHYRRARWYAGAMLQGGMNGEEVIPPLEDSILRGKLEDVRGQLAEFEALTRERLRNGSTPAPRSQLHLRQHTLLRRFTETASEVEASLRGRLHRRLRTFRITQAILISTGAAMALAVGGAFHRFERRRVEAFRALRAARQETAASEERFRQLVQHAADAFFLATLDGVLVDVNPQACKSLGYGREELLGLKVGEVEVGLGGDAISRIWGAMKPGVAVTVEGLHRRRDGSTFPVEVRALLLEQGPRRLVLGLARDITERKRAEAISRRGRDELERLVRERTAQLSAANADLEREVGERRIAEEALRYSEYKYATLVDHCPSGIFIYRDNRIVFANRRLEEMLGYDREALPGTDPREFIHDEDWPRAVGAIRAELTGTLGPTRCEVRARTRYGKTVWLEVITTPLRYRGGTSVLGNVQDVTGRVEMERALDASRKELQQLSWQLLEGQEEERARTARDLHEGIGQSLSAVKYAVEHALGEMGEAGGSPSLLPLRSLIPAIQGSVEEIRRLSQALRPPALDDLGILAALGWLCRESRGETPGARIDLDARVAEDQVPARLKTVVFRVCQEAVKNAVRHAGADRIGVELRIRSGTLVLRVEDDGAGFSPEANRAPKTRGRGFGLSRMKEWTELSGGALAVDSAPARGTEVCASWPLGACRTPTSLAAIP